MVVAGGKDGRRERRAKREEVKRGTGATGENWKRVVEGGLSSGGSGPS